MGKNILAVIGPIVILPLVVILVVGVALGLMPIALVASIGTWFIGLVVLAIYGLIHIFKGK